MNSEIMTNAAEENNSPADRLKAARNAKNLTRKQLAELTGIPVKTIEKYEYGGMEPNISRLHILCETLDVTPGEIIGIDPEVSDPDVDIEKPLMLDDKISGFFKECMLHIHELDRMRKGGFLASPIKGRAHLEELRNELRFLEENEMRKLAENRKIWLAEEQDYDLEVLTRRIVDTVVFGIDFYAVQLSALIDMAEEYELSPSDRLIWLEWHGYEEIVPEIRTAFYEAAFSGGDYPDFEDSERFPPAVYQ